MSEVTKQVAIELQVDGESAYAVESVPALVPIDTDDTGAVTDHTNKSITIYGRKGANARAAATITNYTLPSGFTFVSNNNGVLTFKAGSQASLATAANVEITATYDGLTFGMLIPLVPAKQGEAGTDADDTEWIYKYDANGYDGTAGEVNPSGAASGNDTNKQQKGWVPENWYNHALAISASNTIVYASYRTLNGATGQWGAFQTPIEWSHWGRNGQDGDGTEYVFIRTQNNVAPVMDSTQTGCATAKFLPTITSASQTESGTEQAQTTDNPKGANETYPFEWVAKRTMSDPDASGARAWTKYTGENNDYKMSLWSNLGQNGNGIVSITRTFAISNVGTTASETTEPTHQGSWTVSSPSVTPQYPYLWAKEVTVFTDTTKNTTKYYCIGARGDNGVDAQDIEWVYIRSKTPTPPVIFNDNSYTDSNSHTYTTDGHLPHVTGNENIENNQSTYECTDDPKGVTDTWKYEWEIKRTKGAADATTGARTWNYYSGTMTMHNNYAESAFIIDIDNDNDQFGTDSDSKVLVEQNRSTKVTLYDGAAPQTLTSLTATLKYEDGTSVPTSVATKTTDATTGAVSVTVLQNNTANTHTEIQAHISATCAKGTKTIVFTLYKIMSGAPGLTPIIYNVEPTVKSLVFNRDASNNLTPSSVASQINVARTEGNTTTTISSATTGLTYSWGFEDEATATNAHSGLAIGTSISISNTDASSHSSIWVLLSTGDRETLSIVKDGAKGAKGDSIRKDGEVSTYKVSDSGTTTPTGTWYDTKADANTAYPWTEDRYMWTKTVITWSDTSTTTLYSAERNPNDGDAGQDIVVDEQEIKYSKQSSGSIDPSTLTYGDYPSTLTKGDWLYVKTTVYYKKEDSATQSHDAGSSVSYSVQYQSKDGDNGRSLSGITEHYKASSSSSSSQWSVPSSGTWSGEWGTSPIPSNFNSTNKYLWNYEKITYTESNGTTTIQRTSPSIITTYGKAIDSIVNYYKASTKDGTTSGNSESRPSSDPTGSSSSDGWTIAVQTPTSSEPFLWNYEKITYIDTNGGPSTDYTSPHVIGHFGTDGTSPIFADLDNEMSGVACSSNGVVSSEQPVITNVKMYRGTTPLELTSITCKIGDVTLGTSYSSSTSSVAYYYKAYVTTSTGAVVVTVRSGATISTKTDVDIYVTDGTETRTLTLTINGVRGGAKGEPAVIYNLRPSASSISVGRTDSGGYTPTTFNLTCGYTKNNGGAMSAVTDATSKIDSTYYIYFRRRKRSKSTWDELYYRYGYSTNKAYVTSLDVTTYDLVEFIMCTATATSFYASNIGSYTVIDKETVPVISDGEKGASITKTSEIYSYGVNESSTTPPSQDGNESQAAVLNKWYSTRAKVSSLWTENRYLWTKTVITWSDTSTTTLYSAERNPDDGDAGMSIVIASQGVTYSKQTRGDLDPTTLTYGDYPSSLNKGDWLYSKTTVTYETSEGESAGSTNSYAVSYIGTDGVGVEGRGITGVYEHYKASANATGETTPTSSSSEWGTNPSPSDWDADKPYLWNYERITYSKGTTPERTTASVIAVWTEDGRGVDSIVNFYKKSNLSTGVGYPANDPDGGGTAHSGGTETGWSASVQAPDETDQYLWNYERVTWIEKDGTYSYTYADPHVIGHYGKDGKSITSANVWYALNQSPTQAPSNYTLDDFPTELIADDYVWQATKVTYSDGGSEFTAKMCLGATTDFLSGTEVYAISTSNSTAPDDNQFGTTYNKTKGYYLWTATRVQYTNGNYAYLNKKCVGYWGEDGTSPYLADLDNEMGGVVCDSDGNTTSEQYIETNAQLFKGTTAQTLKSSGGVVCSIAGYPLSNDYTSDPSPSRTYKAVISGLGTTSANIKVYVKSGTSVDNVDIKVTLTDTNDVSRDATLTMNGVRGGENGDPAVLFNILPSVSTIKKDADNVLSPTSLTCDVRKVTGNSTPTRATSSDGTLRYRIDGDITSTSEGTALTINTGTVDSYTATSKYITFAFFKGTTLVDKERVPIVYDGNKGDDGNGYKTIVYRDNFTEAYWAIYGAIGHTDTWVETSSTRNGCGVGDWFLVVGTATDSKDYHTATYECDNSSGDLHGKCINHQVTKNGLSITITPSTFAVNTNSSGVAEAATQDFSISVYKGGTKVPVSEYNVTHSTLSSGWTWTGLYYDAFRIQCASDTSFTTPTVVITTVTLTNGDSISTAVLLVPNRQGNDGASAIHLDLDNEMDAIQYAGSTKVGGDVTSQATLYNGGAPITSGVTWANDSSSTATGTVTSSGLITVTGLPSNALRGVLVVKATYSSVDYYATFTVDKLVDKPKYEISVDKPILSANTSETSSTASIEVRVYKTTVASDGTITRTNISSLGDKKLFYQLDSYQPATLSYSSGAGSISGISYSSNHSVVVWLTDSTGSYSSKTTGLLDIETIPVVGVQNGGQGIQGKMGRFPYFAGVWESFASNATFVASDTATPYFQYTSSGQIRYSVWKGANGTGSGSTIAKSSMGTIGSGSNWDTMVNDFKYLITEALFTDMAKLGGGIFNGDYAFSQYGTDANGAQVSDYQYFMPASTQTMVVSSTSLVTIGEFTPVDGRTYKIRFNCSEYDSGVEFVVNTSVSTSGAFRYTCAGKSFDVNLTAVSSYKYYIMAHRTSGSTSRMVSAQVVDDNVFNPNLWIDWFRGEIYAQLGRFVNVTVEGVINNQALEINDSNYGNYGYSAGSGQPFCLNTAKVGSLIEYKVSKPLRLPCALISTPQPRELGMTMKELRQCIGKKLYIYTDGNTGMANIQCYAGSTSHGMLIERKERLAINDIDTNIVSPTPAQYLHKQWQTINNYNVLTASTELETDGFVRYAQWASPSSMNGHFFVLECKLGCYFDGDDNWECIYWELTRSGYRQEFD